MNAIEQIVEVTGLPAGIQHQLSAWQRSGLAFASRSFKVTSANVQTFQVAAVSRGLGLGAGPTHALGAAWGLFAAIGVFNVSTQNIFRTDIQLKLEDPQTGEKVFFLWSLPFAITLSIEVGESLTFFFVRGGLPTPQVGGDFRLDDWTPFVAQNMDTGQIVPVGPLPSLIPSRWSAIALRRAAGIGLLLGPALIVAASIASAYHDLINLADPRPSAYEYELSGFHLQVGVMLFFYCGVVAIVAWGSARLRQ
jgi:hypothetical protein